MLKGSEKGLELNARLTGPKWRARSSGDVADMNDRCAPASPSAQKLRDFDFSVVIVSNCGSRPSHPDLHVDDQ